MTDDGQPENQIVPTRPNYGQSSPIDLSVNINIPHAQSVARQFTTTQSGNTVDGDLAGGHVIKPQITVNLPKRVTAMRALVEKYKRELAQNCAFRQIIDELQHFINSVDSEVVGLEKKFAWAGRSDETKSALALKEIFYKKLMQHQLSESAQQIFAYLLGMAQTHFESKIYPKLLANAGKMEVDAVISQEVIQPIMDELDENVLLLFPTDIRGMLFFLTGNCHIKWHK